MTADELIDDPGPIRDVYEALEAFQRDLPTVARSTEGQAGNRTYMYAPLEDVTAVVLPKLNAVGLTWSTRPTMRRDGRFVLAYALRHPKSGTAIKGDYPIPDAQPQQIGSAITYARRYALCAVTGVTPAGDDNDAAPGSQRQTARQPDNSMRAGIEATIQRHIEALYGCESMDGLLEAWNAAGRDGVQRECTAAKNEMKARFAA